MIIWWSTCISGAVPQERSWETESNALHPQDTESDALHSQDTESDALYPQDTESDALYPQDTESDAHILRTESDAPHPQDTYYRGASTTTWQLGIMCLGQVFNMQVPFNALTMVFYYKKTYFMHFGDLS